MIYDFCPKIPPLSLRQCQYTKLTGLTGKTLGNFVQQLECNANIFESKTGENINSFPALGLWLEDDCILQLLFESFFSRSQTSTLEFQGLAFLSHCCPFNSDNLKLPFGLLQPSPRVVVCRRQVTTLCNDIFQPNERRLSKKGTLHCLKDQYTGLNGTSTALCEPLVWAQDFLKVSGSLLIECVQNWWTDALGEIRPRSQIIDAKDTSRWSCWIQRGIQ